MRSVTDESGVAVCVLAGGASTRLSAKLARPFGEATLLRHTVENAGAVGPVYVSFRDERQAASLGPVLAARFVYDEEPDRGPLGGLVSALRVIPNERVYVVAGDAPFAGLATFSQLDAAWKNGLEGCVAINGLDELQPLCAIYKRDAFLRKATAELQSGSGAVRRAVEGLRIARVRLTDERALINVNTEAEYEAAREVIR